MFTTPLMPEIVRPALKSLPIAPLPSTPENASIHPRSTAIQTPKDSIDSIALHQLRPTYETYVIPSQLASSGLAAKRKWRNKEYRQAYAEAAIEQGIAWQVRINRERRGLTQKQLAQIMSTKQSSISRMEDPEYGAHSLQQLMKVAHTFDCALIVKLASYSTLARESDALSESQLYAASYDEEISEEIV